MNDSRAVQNGPHAVVLWTLWFSLFSMAMLLGSRGLQKQLPFPQGLTCIQLSFAVTSVFPFVLKSGRTQLSNRGFACYVVEGVLFSLSILASLKSLSLTNIGTMTIARSLLPIVVFAVERAVGLKVALSRQSVFSLFGVVSFGVVYAVDAKGAEANVLGLCWTLAWIVLLAGQMVYGKWLVTAVEVKQLERVLYTNAFGLPLLIPSSIQELRYFYTELTSVTAFFLILTCVVGVGIGYASWELRSIVTATTFSLIGVLNKVGTICLAFLIWPEEGSFVSFAALMGCLISGTFYQGATREIFPTKP
jgi:hypothetical protein